LNDWTHRLDANSLQLNNGSIAFIGSPEFQSKYGSLQATQDTAGTANISSMFAGLNASAATNLYEHVFHHAGGLAGVNWTGLLQAGGSIGQGLLGFADSLQSHVATAGLTHDAWAHNS
jgi:hypothetical protein